MTDHRDLFRLDDRVALIVGGGGGIGSAMAEALGGVGASVSIAGRSAERAEAAAARVREAGAQSLAVVADANNPVDCERMVAETVDRFGRLDIILNAVGGGAGTALHAAEQYPTGEWDRIVDLNLTSTVLPTQAAVKAMIAGKRGGRVLNVSSVRGQLGIDAGYSAYVAAKGAINALTRQWATEWAKYGITVNAISPTFVDTPQVATLLQDAEFKAKIVSRIPLRRIGTTEDLVGAVLLFCSDASSFITGQILTIDGGLTATQ
ncbi:MAG: short-chain dehydrogenase [Actinobacteria bacterium 13_1_20CM_2_65_11]|nr:MAG: short-chain dehydrogenase [Actinobacteria bacterium 13_1_20CM_2_65_11]